MIGWLKGLLVCRKKGHAPITVITVVNFQPEGEVVCGRCGKLLDWVEVEVTAIGEIPVHDPRFKSKVAKHNQAEWEKFMGGLMNSRLQDGRKQK